MSGRFGESDGDPPTITGRRLALDTAADPSHCMFTHRSGQKINRQSKQQGGTAVPSKSANVKNEKQYEALKDKGMSKQRAAKIANSPGASSRGGKKSGS